MQSTHDEQKIENIVVIGRDGVGKTRLIDALLHIKTRGKGPRATVEQPEEAERNYTLYNRFYNLQLHGYTLNFIDTPGNTNFLPKVNAALHVATAAVFVVSATGVSETSLREWEAILQAEKPRALFVNMLDQADANFENALHGIEKHFEIKPVVLTLPYLENGELLGIIDVLSKKLIHGATGSLETLDVPRSMAAEVERYYSATVEALAEQDDALLERYLEGEAVSPELLAQALKTGVETRALTPVLCGSARAQIGVDALDDFMESNFPAHSQGHTWMGHASREEGAALIERRPVSSEPFSAIAFKTLHNRYAGKLTVSLCVSGTLTKGDKILNSSNDRRFLVGRVSILNGDNLEEVEKAVPGDLFVLEKVDDIDTNQTLCDANNPIYFDPIQYPEPRCTFAVNLKGSTNEDRLITSLHKIVAEDPSLRMHRNEETGELLLSGMGVLHLEVAQQHLKNAYDLEISLSNPTVVYRETITKKVTVRGRHKKQSGGHGQYGDVQVHIEPLPRGSGFVFESQIVGGVVPRQYIPSVETGVKAALKKGQLGGYPVVDVKVTLFDGTYHSVDSSDIAFQLAGSLAVRTALPDAGSILLEPIMQLEVDVPEHDVGKITKDISSRRGRILGYDMRGHNASINAEAPLAELSDYASALRQMTQGLGIYSMSFQGYEPLTSHLTAKVLAERQS